MRTRRYFQAESVCRAVFQGTVRCAHDRQLRAERLPDRELSGLIGSERRIGKGGEQIRIQGTEV